VTATSLRRPVPADYQQAELTLTGTSALLMNSGEVDRDSDLFRDFTILSQKRAKTLDDEARIREMEWALRLYFDDEIGPFVPGKNVKEALRSAATKWKRDADVQRSLIVVDYRIPLSYAGPRDQQGLWDAGYRYTAMVANAGMNRGRVVRCRPCFDGWSITTTIGWDPEDLDYDLVQRIVKRSEKYGLGDYRPEFGSFTAQLGVVESRRDGSLPNGGSKPEPRSKRAHAAAVDKIAS
jgi:hypothetical protein